MQCNHRVEIDQQSHQCLQETKFRADAGVRVQVRSQGPGQSQSLKLDRCLVRARFGVSLRVGVRTKAKISVKTGVKVRVRIGVISGPSKVRKKVKGQNG